MSEPRFLVDPYKEWVDREGVPVHEGFGLDLLELDLAPWPRLGANGAFAHLTGRGDFVDMQVVEMAPGGKQPYTVLPAPNTGNTASTPSDTNPPPFATKARNASASSAETVRMFGRKTTRY